jgi:exodeoxyribonuclease VII small subunit
VASKKPNPASDPSGDPATPRRAAETRGDAPKFEDSIRRLSEIVETLESGELPLEESLSLFEEGVKLARSSQATLDHAEKRVEELLSIDEHGNPVVRELDLE